jgi:uncharacterized protein (TIGR02453 family)
MASKSTIEVNSLDKSCFEYLNQLSKNNNREWFNANKNEFIAIQNKIEVFADAVLVNLNKHDNIETISGKKSMHRIYRDIRFSKDKTPYKNNWSGGFTRATQNLRGGYYYHIEPNNTIIAGGFWDPSPTDLASMRQEILYEESSLRKILNNKHFIFNFETLKGDQLKLSPKGFDPQHSSVDLLRYKQYLLIRKFTNKEVLADNFLLEVNNCYKAMRPFFNFMSTALSSDHNGLPV